MGLLLIAINKQYHKFKTISSRIIPFFVKLWLLIRLLNCFSFLSLISNEKLKYTFKAARGIVFNPLGTLSHFSRLLNREWIPGRFSFKNVNTGAFLVVTLEVIFKVLLSETRAYISYNLFPWIIFDVEMEEADLTFGSQVRPLDNDKEMTETDALSLIILELNYTRPFDPETDSVQVKWNNSKIKLENWRSNSSALNKRWHNCVGKCLKDPGQYRGLDQICSIQVVTSGYFGRKSTQVVQESSYGTNRVWTNNPTFLLSGQLTGNINIECRIC